MTLAGRRTPGLRAAGAVTRPGEPVADRKSHRLGSALRADFREDAVHVRLDRRLAENEPFTDLPVGQPFADEREHLSLARREVSRKSGGRADRLGWAAGAKRADETRLDRRVQPCLSAVDGPDGGLDVLGARVLREVTDGTRAEDVAADVRDGYVSLEAARDLYGVVLQVDTDTGAITVDAAATEARRGELRAPERPDATGSGSTGSSTNGA
jgi:hypothetical protein